MSKTGKKKFTPLIEQYFEIRNQFPDTVLMFQVGDFYEMFFDDAKKASAFLGIALTKRGTLNGEPIPLCGVPVHALDHHLTKLVKGGFKVAICDQLQEAVPGQVVKRGVTRVLTPGTLTDSKLLDDKSASYLFSFFPTGDNWGLMFGELLTAQLFATILPVNSQNILESEIMRFLPDEILLPQNKLGKSFQSQFKRLGYFTTFQELDFEDSDYLENIDRWVKKQFKKDIIEIINKNDSLLYSLYNFYAYVSRNQIGALEHFNNFNFYNPDDFLILDASTQKNLELVKNKQDGSRKNTLFYCMDKAATSMGSRMVKKWLLRPLVKRSAIEQRLDIVQLLSNNIVLNQKLYEYLIQIGDIERIVGRIALKRASLNDYIYLMHALEVIPDVKKLLSDFENIFLLKIISEYLSDFHNMYTLISNSLNDDSSVQWIIKKDFDPKLDKLRELVYNSNKNIFDLEKKEKKETGINSLKVGYNKINGYYIEVTKANIHLVPDRYIRQQTLTGRERFITGELKDLQYEIIKANATINQVEKEIFEAVKNEIYSYVPQLRRCAHALANLDSFLSFANVAYDNGYVRPEFNEGKDIIIKEGRHPVVQEASDITFIPNDTFLVDDQSLWIITGPNMGGKSTFLRQVALICIMAQCGSFVPAKSTNLPLLDRVFTRIGSGDNLALGKSTFLVEMEEAALICRQATAKSLVILDEVGRGTSTFDGLAIAQAVVEYIHSKIKARCLFATHYHELTDLKDLLEGIESYYAASKQTENGIVFLYKIIRGVADGSFGLEVAKLANLPDVLVCRAEDILYRLEAQKHLSPNNNGQVKGVVDQEDTYGMILAENRAMKAKIRDLQVKCNKQKSQLESLKNIDYNELSPKVAFDLLWDLKES